MTLQLIPRRLSGVVRVPASKSMAHRLLIGAALGKDISVLRDMSASSDIDATIDVLSAFGAHITREGDITTVEGIKTPPDKAVALCRESGSTLRFLMPVAAVLGMETTFCGEGRLPSRPVTPYQREFPPKGVTFEGEGMPFTLKGRLRGGVYTLEGDISSQFVTGLLLALPLAGEDSVLKLLSPLQSKPYADMTLDCMQRFGVTAREAKDGYEIPGKQHYHAADTSVEGDCSQAAFFLAANALGSQVHIENFPENSKQGDARMAALLSEMYHEGGDFFVDASDIPDLVPILAVAACLAPRRVTIGGAARLRLKESDRLASTAALLNTLGGRVTILPDGLEITPVKGFHGGSVSGAGDHRIVMCAAIAATRADAPVTVTGAECVKKSYPAFFEDYQALGGMAHGIHLESSD